MKLLFHEEAFAEFDEAIRWYNEQRSGLGLRFLDTVRAVIRFVEADPNAGSPADNGLRYRKTSRFPYLIYWLVADGAIWIVAVAHARRRPEYWRHRKPTR